MSGPLPFEDIKRAALANIRSLLPSWFPAGKVVGHEFKVGNLRGDPGKSLSINLNTGWWEDFATGDKGGDLIDLFAAKQHIGDLGDAARQVGAIVGIGIGEKINGAYTNGHANGHSHQADDWRPMIPPPKGTAPPPASMLAGFDVVHEYTALTDFVTHFVGQIEAKGDRGKVFVPIVYGTLNGKTGWHKKHPASPKPLYGLNKLTALPNAPVMLCEGEKAADAAQVMFPEYACISWCGGTGSVDHADLAPLKGRAVIIWPDADEAGLKAAAKLKVNLPSASVVRVDGLPDRFDAADLLTDNPEAWLRERLPKPEPDNEYGEPLHGEVLLPLVWIEDIEPVMTAQDFVAGVLVDSSLTVVYGDSGVGKTFWVTDLALHVAAGMRWNGRRVDQGGVIYCVLEGGNGFLNRVSAWKDAHNVGPIPFGAIKASINLLDPKAHTDILIATINAAGKERGFDIKLVVVDTLSRALFGGNENTPEDMGTLVINAERIIAETGACVVFVHHCGKDAARGARGHSLLRAALGTEIEVVANEQTGDRIANVVKQRDLAKPQPFGFQLENVVLGQNQYGENVTTCLIQPAIATTQPEKLSPDQQLALTIFDKALKAEGTLSTIEGVEQLALAEIAWRNWFYREAKPGKTQEAKRQAFTRCAEGLISKGRIIYRDDLCWRP